MNAIGPDEHVAGAGAGATTLFSGGRIGSVFTPNGPHILPVTLMGFAPRLRRPLDVTGLCWKFVSSLSIRKRGENGEIREEV